MRDEWLNDLASFHPSSFIPHPFGLVRLRTYPQHTRLWLPLLRSRPGGVHRTYVVRSPKSDDSIKALPIANCQLRIGACYFCARCFAREGEFDPPVQAQSSSTIGNWQLAIVDKSNRRLAMRHESQQTIYS